MRIKKIVRNGNLNKKLSLTSDHLLLETMLSASATALMFLIGTLPECFQTFYLYSKTK